MTDDRVNARRPRDDTRMTGHLGTAAVPLGDPWRRGALAPGPERRVTGRSRTAVRGLEPTRVTGPLRVHCGRVPGVTRGDGQHVAGARQAVSEARRIVVKVGSSSLT